VNFLQIFWDRCARTILALTLLALFSPILHAQYKNVPVTLTQPNGTKIHVYVSGSQKYNWIHDEKGYTIVQDPESGNYVYALQSGSGLVASTHKVNESDPQTLGIEPNIKSVPAKLIPAVRKGNATASFGGSVPSHGNVNTLVVFVRFSDQDEFTDPASVYDSYFNDIAPNHVSLRNYYREVSSNSLDISSYLVGANGGVITSYKDAHPRDYYVPFNQVANPIGYQTGNDGEFRLQQLLANALQGVSSQIPVGLTLDANNDGAIDNVTFIVRGDPTGWSNVLWPHMSTMSAGLYVNGKQARTYNFQIESFLKVEGVSVLCHEMFHSIGAPDLYHYSLDNLNPVAAWDVMAQNAIGAPQHMLAYMKYKYGHWLSSIPEITTTGIYTLAPQSSSGTPCYKIQSPYSSSEYFVVEYRNPSSSVFEASLPGAGLLVTRVNTAVEGTGDAGQTDEVYVYRPGGNPLQMTDGFPTNAALTSDANRIAINDHTDPACNLANGGIGGLEIDSVSSIGGTISFSVRIHSQSKDIRLNSPTGSQILTGGTNCRITWASAMIDSVDILFTSDYGQTWQTVAERYPAAAQNYVWNLPFVSSSGCQFIVRYSDNWAFHSNATEYFTLTKPTDAATGLKWEKVGSGDLDAAVESFGENSNGDLYVTTWPRKGVIISYKSTDGGASWDTVKTLYTPQESYSQRTTKWEFSKSGKILASDGLDVFLSTDNALTWTTLRRFDPTEWVYDYRFKGEDTVQVLTTHTFAWSRITNGVADGWTTTTITGFSQGGFGNMQKFWMSGSTIYAASHGEGLFKSTDNGASWTTSNSGLTTMLLFTVVELKNGNMLIGSKEGIFVSSNHGANWMQIADTCIKSAFIISFAEMPDGRVLAGSYGCHGAGAGAFLSADGGFTWTRCNDGLLQTSPRILFYSKNNYVYTGVGYGDASLPGGIYRLDLSSPLVKWKSRLSMTELASGNVSPVNLVFGQATNATVGTDAILRESVINATPQLGRLGGVFVLQDGSGAISSTDFRNAADNVDSWKVQLQSGALGFPVRLQWQLDSTITTGLYLLDSASATVVNMRTVSSYDVTKAGPLTITTNGALAGVAMNSANTAQEYRLEQNYPNPFNPSTRIAYVVPAGAGRGVQVAGSEKTAGSGWSVAGNQVRLAIYDVLGRQVTVLVDGVQEPGRHEVVFDAKNLSSGTYFYRLTVGLRSETKRMVLLR
jgi:M6 family metalloprotease-like protein